MKNNKARGLVEANEHYLRRIINYLVQICLCEVFFEVESPTKLIEQCERFKTNILLLEIKLAKNDGLVIIKQIKNERPIQKLITSANFTPNMLF